MIRAWFQAVGSIFGGTALLALAVVAVVRTTRPQQQKADLEMLRALLDETRTELRDVRDQLTACRSELAALRGEGGMNP